MQRHARVGFTLVELLVVVAIIGILAGLLMPAVNAARESARAAECRNNLANIGKGLKGYENDHNAFPPARLCDDDATCHGNNPKLQGAMSAFVMILPQMEEGVLFNGISETSPIWGTNSDWKQDETSLLIVRKRLKFYTCPSEASPPTTTLDQVEAAVSSYALVSGNLGTDDPGGEDAVKYANTGMFIYKLARTRAHVKDGMSQTMFVGETIDPGLAGNTNIWSRARYNRECMRTTDYMLNSDPFGGRSSRSQPIGVGVFASRHRGGVYFVFGDAHVVFINDQIEPDIYQALSTINGRELVSAEHYSP